VRIAIAGAGMAGSYAYRLLVLSGDHDVDVFDRARNIACGIAPCGYAVDGKFNDLIRRVGLDPSRYALHVPPRLVANILEFAARSSIFMIDKPAVIADLLDSAHVHYERLDPSRYDLVVDATGEARAYAPPLVHDAKARVVQWRVRLNAPAVTTFLPTRSVPGYAWVMPLSPDGRDVHVGAGCLARTRVSTRELTRSVFSKVDVASVTCACGSRIRLSGPEFDRVVAGQVWTVGEAAGLVSPSSGAGNVYAIESALELVSHLGDPMGYVKALRRRFAALVPEARAVVKILRGRLPTPLDVYHIRLGWARVGVEVAWRHVPRLALEMRGWFSGEPRAAISGTADRPAEGRT
jgi:flavin-dependent dehydrogenase